MAVLAKKDTVIVYYNGSDEVVKDKNWATYYRKIFLGTDETVGVLDYYQSGIRKMSGFFETKEMLTKVGHFIYYDHQGNKIREGNFENDEKVGEWQSWFASGSKISEGVYKDGKMNGLWNGWYENGARRYEGVYINDKEDGEWFQWYGNDTLKNKGNYLAGKREGEWKLWFKDGGIEQEGVYIEDKREGEWLFYFESGLVSATVEYENDKGLKVVFWNEEGVEVPFDGVLERDPEFKGGVKAMNQFISKKLYYPELAREQSIQGTVYIQFLVQKDGTLSEFEVLKSVHPLLDDEAMRVLKLMPRWTPGVSHNRIIDLEFIIPVNFRIA